MNTTLKKISLLALLSLTFNVCANEIGSFNNNGWTAFFKKDYKEAFEWFAKGAEQNNPTSQLAIGFMYEEGTGVTQDYKQALNWYLKAAEQNNPTSQLAIGIMYAEGRGVTQDQSAAADWYLKAALQDNQSAQYNLGIVYAKGKGVLPNNKYSYAWFSLAAMTGKDDAVENRDIIAKRLSPSGLEEAQELAAKLYEEINNKN